MFMRDKTILKQEYRKLNDLLDDKNLYDPVFVDGDEVPVDRKKRYNWFKDLRVCCR